MALSTLFKSAPAADAVAAPPLAVTVLNPSFLLRDPAIRAPLERADALINETAAADRPALFTEVSLDAFALLAAGEYQGLDNLRAWLPTMPTPEQQVGSVGASGPWAVIQAAAFVRAAVAAYKAEGRDLARSRVLDYGICWARLSRLFYKYVPVGQLFGVDAWKPSLALASTVGYRGALALVDRVPSSLPFPKPFDLVFAFSIFTHLSPTSADAAARTIRAGMKKGGLFCLTVRPSDYWALLGKDGPAHRDQLAATGFGFTPDEWAVTSGNPDYGNSTVSLDYIRANWPGFEVASIEVLAIDGYQIFVALRAV